jgi:hypothetical protein
VNHPLVFLGLFLMHAFCQTTLSQIIRGPFFAREATS